MSRALILGCSHAQGAEMETDPDLPIDQRYDEFGSQHSYPVLVAQDLGYTAENRSIAGGSNDAMFRLFTEQLATLTPTDIVIACWTGCNRSEIWHETEELWLGLSPGRVGFNTVKPNDIVLSGWDSGRPVKDHDVYVEYQRQWTQLNTGCELGRLNKIKNILALNTLAQLHNIQVINIDSFAPITEFKWPVNVSWVVGQSFMDWSKDRKYPTAKWNHYYLAAHRAYADYVLSCLARL